MSISDEVGLIGEAYAAISKIREHHARTAALNWLRARCDADMTAEEARSLKTAVRHAEANLRKSIAALMCNEAKSQRLSGEDGIANALEFLANDIENGEAP